MAVITFTASGLNFLANSFCGNTSETATIIALGSGTPTGSALGSEYVGYGFARGAATPSYVDTSTYPKALKLSKTFTASGADNTLTEVAIYSTGGSPVYIAYVLFSEHELANNGVVPDGQDITVDFYFSYSAGTCSGEITWGVDNESLSGAISADIQVEGFITTSLNPANFTCSSFVCFNGYKITNASITSTIQSANGRQWDISGYTEDHTDIERLNYFAYPASIGYTVGGKQYVNSIVLPGALKLKNRDGVTYTTYNNCYIVGEITENPFGVGWEFSLKMVQAWS